MSAVHIRYGRGHTVPLSIILSAIPSLPRPVLARLIDRAIERLDGDDGDSDLEPSGDELDTANAEDEALTGPSWVTGPGCHISDDDDGVDDGGEQTDEREPEAYDGGHPDIPPDHRRFHMTA